MPTLFVCEDNAGPSQLAEALARSLWADAQVWSAGVAPSHVRPQTRRVLLERGIPPEGMRAKPIDAVPLEEVTLVVRIGRAVQPRLPGHLPVVDWRLPDPDSYPDDERLEAYRACADEIERRLKRLPPEHLR